MGFLCNLIDAVLFFFFLAIAVAAPLIDGQTCLPIHIFPDFLIDLKQWYTREYGDYLFDEKPHFFVGVIWLELLFQWPLSLLNLYGIVAKASWYNTTCLIHGVSVFTSMIAILAELIRSQKASDKLMMMYCTFMGLGVLAILRGLLANCSKSTTSSHGKRNVLARKKRA